MVFPINFSVLVDAESAEVADEVLFLLRRFPRPRPDLPPNPRPPPLRPVGGPLPYPRPIIVVRPDTVVAASSFDDVVVGGVPADAMINFHG